jgi:hypothetical protein
MLVPFRDNGHLDTVQKKFNACHTSTRVDVERAIGLLKCKFLRLKHLEMHLEQEIPVVIASCCVLHNFILKYETADIAAIDDIDTVQARFQNIPIKAKTYLQKPKHTYKSQNIPTKVTV